MHLVIGEDKMAKIQINQRGVEKILTEQINNHREATA